MALEQMTSALGVKNAKHLLQRATFGPTKAEIDDFAAKTPAQALSDLFQTQTEPTRPASWNWYEVYAPGGTSFPRLTLVTRWWLGVMLKSGANIREKLVWLLHVHFTTQKAAVSEATLLHQQNVLFRKLAYDGPLNVKDLTKKICLDNAMMRFLNGNQNTKARPQENFARELLELYTVGRGRNVVQTDPGDYKVFKQTDIEQTTLLMTGFKVNEKFDNLDPDTGLPRAELRNHRQHNNDSKQFSNYFNNTTITPDATLFDTDGNPTEGSMRKEVDDLIEMLFQNTETAMHMCRRIYRFFCHYNITDDIDNNIIADLAQTYKDNNFNLQPVIENLLGSKHFYDSANGSTNDDNYGVLIKSPLDLVLSAFRFLGVTQESQFDDFENNLDQLRSDLKNAGIDIYEPLDVAGYPAYHQDPIYNRAWISSTLLANRYDLVQEFIGTAMDMNDYGVTFDVINFFETTISVPSDINVLLDELITYLLPAEISTERRGYFRSVLNEDFPDANWTTEWNNRTSTSSQVDAQLRKLLNAMMQSPEYQLF
ncbi:hypothetical protein BKI52_01555 [marine bacterium AO1-C]|nr:hypothetical protein BKI52_01555 [marine bacterium AO1-C]